MTNYANSPEVGERQFLANCVERVNRAPDLLEAARNRQFSGAVIDPYAEAARQAQMISAAQQQGAGEPEGSVTELNTAALQNQAALLARPSADVNLAKAA